MESKLLQFTINGIEQRIHISKITLETTLNEYLRTHLGLTGTKLMCQEGGCGVCVVAIEKPNIFNKNIHAANSCLIPLLACNGWNIYTIEGLNTQKNNLSQILTKFNGSQCGYCSPGMVMNMYCLSKNNKNLTMQEVENSFGGHICRCTGYRPIIEAFKSVCAKDYSDIEDITLCKNTCKISFNSIQFRLQDIKWIKVFNLSDLHNILKSAISYQLVAGHTSYGVYPINKVYNLYIDISDVTQLKEYKIGKELEIGANLSLTEMMKLFTKIAEENSTFSYLKVLAAHIDLVATVSIRNLGTIAGNLMIKYYNHEFPSDLFVMLETVGAKLRIVGNGTSTIIPVVELLKIKMDGKLIEKIILSPYTDNFKLQTYKIMPRAQNAHAMLNAGFLLELTEINIVKSCRIVYGCINPSFVHAETLEKFLVGKNIFKNDILQTAFSILDTEINPDNVLVESSPIFRKKLAISLFYKFILSITPSNILKPENESGRYVLTRPVSSSTHDLNESASVTTLVNKIEGLEQSSGTAQYIMDMPNLSNQLFGAWVLAKASRSSTITSVNTEQALKIDGVVNFVDYHDILGTNSFTPTKMGFADDEEVFCSGFVKYYNQPIGLIVAKTQNIANKAADLVKVTYNQTINKPAITIQDVLSRHDEKNTRIFLDKKITSTNLSLVSDKSIQGSFQLSWQYHFHMETQCCNVVPSENDNINVYPSSQWLNLSNCAVASVLNIPANKVNVSIRRLGGGFGAKLVRNALVACAASIAAFKLKQPVKLWMPFTTNMEVIGKRYPLLSNYRVNIDKEGVVQNFQNDFYTDYGTTANEAGMPFLLEPFLEVYDTKNWNVNAYSTRTDNTPSCYIRAPGSCEGVAMIEAIMEHVAVEANLDPVEFRMKNIKQTKHSQLLAMIKELIEFADINDRKQKIKDFNNRNKWIKQGLAVVPMCYPFHLFTNYGVIVSIYQYDGTVSIAHGGVEMGQGINTKAAQVCAYKLGIPIEKISVKPSNNLIAPNAHMTGGSLTSETGIIKACDILLERIQPIKNKMIDASWEEVISKCGEEYVNLSATYMSSPKEPNIESYTIYGVCASEIELDVLTGQHIIKRVDLYEDVGQSINTNIDIGQVEGAFVMGIGYFTTEKIVIDDDGKLLTNRTWNYKPPGFKDIPVDFRVKFPKNTLNKVGVLNSKAMAEPPLCLACSIPLAIRNAVASARSCADPTASKWYPFEGPSTVENTFLNCLPDFQNYTL